MLLQNFVSIALVFTKVICLQEKMEMDVEGYLRRRYEGRIADVEIVGKEDLDLVSNFRYHQLNIVVPYFIWNVDTTVL